jgi:hypothetical protein
MTVAQSVADWLLMLLAATLVALAIHAVGGAV